MVDLLRLLLTLLSWAVTPGKITVQKGHCLCAQSYNSDWRMCALWPAGALCGVLRMPACSRQLVNPSAASRESGQTVSSLMCDFPPPVIPSPHHPMSSWIWLSYCFRFGSSVFPLQSLPKSGPGRVERERERTQNVCRQSKSTLGRIWLGDMTQLVGIFPTGEILETEL